MNTEKLLRNLKLFDPELWEALRFSLSRQLGTLSLIPTANAASPFSSYLKGSTLGNDFLDHHAAEHYDVLEKMAVQRACSLFGAQHAIVRTGNPTAASRVVLLALAKTGDRIMSFNLRKQEHCSGSQMQYDFVKFGVEPDTLKLDFAKIGRLARETKPSLIIYSPVNYPRNIDYQDLKSIAAEVGAYLWVDLGQNSGLAAAKKMTSPVPLADVVTFAASDALHGPQSGIILCKNKLADLLEQTIIDTGHVSLKKNVLAALTIVFREAACEEYRDYAQQVLDNAGALEKGIKDTGIDVLCSPTENHLVLLKLPQGINGETVEKKLAAAGLLVKAEPLLTADDNVTYPILRLSSLDATTRSLDEGDMRKIGRTLGNFLRSPQDDEAVKAVAKVIRKTVENLPLFSEDWLPELETVQDEDTEIMLKAMVHGYA